MKKIFAILILFCGLFVSCDNAKKIKVEAIYYGKHSNLTRYSIKPDPEHSLYFYVYEDGTTLLQEIDFTRDNNLVAETPNLKLGRVEYIDDLWIKEITIGDIKYISTRTEN